MRQQLMLQHLFAQPSQQDGSDPGSGSSSSSSSSYLSSAPNWLLGIYGYGYTQLLQASQQQQIAADPATGSGQVCYQLVFLFFRFYF
jgi:hypothetical protein